MEDATRHYNKTCYRYIKNRRYPYYFWRDPGTLISDIFDDYRVITYTDHDMKINVALCYYPQDENKRYIISKLEF